MSPVRSVAPRSEPSAGSDVEWRVTRDDGQVGGVDAPVEQQRRAGEEERARP